MSGQPRPDIFCVVSQEMPLSMQNILASEVSEVILLPPDTDLAEPVRCHPDMVFAVLDGRMFLSARYYEAFPGTIMRIAELGGLKPVPVSLNRHARYPHDVAFNAAVWNDILLCRPDDLCPALLDHAKRSGYRIVPVRQGYTACSCILTSEAILTSDRGIAAVLVRENLPCVLLPEGGIALPGYDCGFPGGACGVLDDTVYVCGSAETLPCASVLHASCRRILSLSDTPVTDYGGIKFFKRI